MLKSFFGEIAQGRLKRLPYLGYVALLVFMIFLIGFGLVLLLGTSEQVSQQIVDGRLAEAQAVMIEEIGGPGLVATLVIGFVIGLCFAFANLNLQAKRLRDIGLPGWIGVLAIFLLGAVISGLISAEAGSVFHTLVFLALVLVPSEALARRGLGARPR